MVSSTTTKYVTFKLDKEFYGIPIENVLSIEKTSKTTRIPNSPDYIHGLLNLRGNVIPIIDLRKKLGMNKNNIDKNSRIIVINENEIIAGLMVDSSSEVLEIDTNNIDKPPKADGNNFMEYIKGIGKTSDKLLILLDLIKILEH
ncbi:chemotaxis protein CheW [Schnuerera sp. xch1]|uniref:chemotaxis protein CheW n=1 Tax=Schnuerera sp. xch1 TaxID=2874283 RepID=UPI001CC1ADAB|nr:chemotaxis protein CheW [Schnuerera sp. xch1]MBZ2173852.1 chemotaxis protein CheW [Schnuerera sp. xch1]